MAELPALGVDTSLPSSDIPGDLATPLAPGLTSQSFAVAPPAPPATTPAVPNDAGAPTASDGSLRSQIVNFAKSFLGTPYVWGGSRPGGFDCSGLVQYVADHFGLHLPRISYQQANSGHAVSISALQPGDLVAWDENSRNAGADHIAFYIGNGYILEAPHTGADVRIRKLGSNEGAWGVHLTYPAEHGHLSAGHTG